MDIRRVIEMASIMIGVAGVAQQLKTANASGGGASAPTSVSIATSSSGNYNNAVISNLADGCGVEDFNFNLDGSEFSTGSADVTVDIGPYGDVYPGCSSIQRIRYYGYIRATGATSYQWDVSINSASLSNGCSVATQGTASTSQDSISGGIGEDVVITFGGGRGGLTFPANGDSLSVNIDATATNSNGSTSATQLQIDYDFSS